uniref:Uncharacterized protein n=1 Tax=Anopheles stephensi TaxID=30069 RepID=A0A182Y2M8_ANOST
MSSVVAVTAKRSSWFTRYRVLVVLVRFALRDMSFVGAWTRVPVGSSSSSGSTVNVGEVSSTCSVGSADETVSSPGYINTATESSISSLDDLKNEGK